ncbi:TonB-dependent receptor [Desulfonatronovibrio hydrogenovorans]|uniref:TonB-dependent receptor n=1 Tax=Desulfonatronovibrio hydrogenovorans TaxID=53245 RepID=UPI00054F4F5B|nr:TonB-dependent receptor [Desulfonatronovibrio hydrogenovorans]
MSEKPGLTGAILFWMICLIWAAFPAHAQEMEDIVVISTPIIDGIVVDSYGSTTTVVTEEQIRNLNAQDLGTALRRTPGVNISRHNQIGSHGGAEGGAVFIRGMGSSRPGAEIKTYIDGVPMYQGFWNHPLLDLLSIDTAQAIEVYKSPQPQYFGNAFGAINIVPKRKTEEGFKTNLHLAGGSYDTIIQRAEHAGKINRTDYYIGQSFKKSGGHRTKADGQLTNYFARIGTELGENWYISGLGLRTDNHAWDPGAKGADPIERDGKYGTESWLGSVKLEHDYDQARGSLQFYANNGEGQQLDRPDGSPDAIWKFKFHGIKAREELNLWPGGEILMGLDYDVFSAKDTRTDNKWDSPTHRITSPYLAINQLIGDESGFYAIPSAGLRYYDHNRFSSETAPHAGLILGYQNTQIHFGYSRGVLFPGVEVAHITRAWPDPDNWKDLKAETMDHYELGISHTWERVRADLTFFRDKGKNRYLVILPPPPPPTYANIGDYRTQGVEATVSYNPLNNLSLFAGLTLLDTDPSDLPYAPKRTFSAGLNWRFLKNFQLSLDGQYISEMHASPETRNTGNTRDRKVSSFYLLNGKLSYMFQVGSGKMDVELFVAGENLTDVNYEYKPDYPMPGINGMAGISVRF